MPAKPAKNHPRAAAPASLVLLDEMRADAAPSQDKLDRARAEVERLRDLEIDHAALTERLAFVKDQIRQIKERSLVDIFDEAGIGSLGLPSSGNLPPYEVELADYYHANIPDDRRDEAFNYLRKAGQADLIKTTFTVEFGLREAKAAERFARSLDKAGIGYGSKCGVPWNTLTAWFRDEHKRKAIPAKTREFLGATVGRVVKVVKQKQVK